MGAEINLDDPGVRRLLEGPDQSRVHKPGQPKRLLQVAGDMDHGVQSRVNLDLGKVEVMVLDKKGDIPLLTLDIYALPGEPLKIGLICPRCRNHLTITGDKKAIDWDPRAENPRTRDIIDLGIEPHMVSTAKLGKLSVEAFECTWELDGDKKVGTSEFWAGGNLCRWKVAIDNNLVKKA